MIRVTAMDGEALALRPEAVLSLQAGPNWQGHPSTSADMTDGPVRLRGEPAELAGQFQARVRLVKLTAGRKGAIWVAVDHVLRVQPASPLEGVGGSHLSVAGHSLHVDESPDVVLKAMDT